jgi:signal transduction histidine kinase
MFRARGLLPGVRAIDLARVDRLIAVALLVEIELQVWVDPSIRDRVLPAVAGVGLAAAVAVRRQRPLAAVFVVLAFMTVRMLFGDPGGLDNVAGVIVAVILLFYGLGAFAPERRSVWMLGLAVVITSANALTKPGGGVSSLVSMELFGVLLPYAVGRAMRSRAARERVSRDAAEHLDAARDSSARAAAYGERARIARELHDVIAHSVSVMVIQAGGAAGDGRGARAGGGVPAQRGAGGARGAGRDAQTARDPG